MYLLPRRRAWRCVSVAMLASLFVIVSPSAQQANDEAIFRANVNLVALDVAVTDSSGMPVAGLPRDAFQATVDGYPADIALFDSTDAPLSVVAAFDQSRSMRPSWPALEQAARVLTKLLRPVDELSIFTFNEHVAEQMPFEPAGDALVSRVDHALNTIRPDGQTAVIDAVRQAVDKATMGRRERRVVVLVSDGADTASHARERDLFEELERRSVAIYSVGLFGRGERGTDARLLRKMAKTTGGAVVLEPDAANLQERVENLFRTIRSRYFVAVKVESPSNGKPELRRIRIQARDQTGRRLRTQHRTEFLIGEMAGVGEAAQ